MYLTAPLRGFSLEFCNDGYDSKTRMIPRPDRQKCDNMCIRLDTIPAFDGQADGIAKTIWRCIMHCLQTRDKNCRSALIFLHYNLIGVIFCYGTLIESHMRSVEWWHFQWPWRTHYPILKVTTYLKSNISTKIQTKWRKTKLSLIGNHTQPIQWYHFQWPWLGHDWDFRVTNNDICRHWISQKRHEIEV